MRGLLWDHYGPTVLGGMLIFLGGAALVVSLIIFGVNAAVAHSCTKSLDRLGLEGDYGFWTGCVVEVDGTSIPLDNYFVNTEK